jgi:predicted  nucleic acid-binding Zn-ribbon protein
MFLRNQHPRIHLVFVPANCTSKLQVADVALQRPFKHGVTSRFNEWAAQQIKQQIKEENIVGLNESFKMATIKPLVLHWCVESWSALRERKQLILDGWQKCCTSLFNVMDPAKRVDAVAAVARRELEQTFVPEEEEEFRDESEAEEEEEDEELDVTQERRFGERKGSRARTQAVAFGFQLDSSAIALTEDSEH